jgi:hypothetical protein
MTLSITTAKRKEYWQKRKVDVMINWPASKIHIIKGFLTTEEYGAVEESAAKKLHNATVANRIGDGKLFDLRKANQAGIKVNWDKEAEDDIIASLSRRVYNYVNHVLLFRIKENGLEDRMSIQYFGRGPDDKKLDSYIPHCNSDCNGLEI